MGHEVRLVDLIFLREFCRNNKSKMAEYIHTFLESLPLDIERLKKSVAQSNYDELKSIAHSLKPQVAFIGLPLLQMMTEALEKDANKKTPLPVVEKLINQYEKAAQDTTNELVQTLLTLH